MVKSIGFFLPVSPIKVFFIAGEISVEYLPIDVVFDNRANEFVGNAFGNVDLDFCTCYGNLVAVMINHVTMSVIGQVMIELCNRIFKTCSPIVVDFMVKDSGIPWRIFIEVDMRKDSPFAVSHRSNVHVH